MRDLGRLGENRGCIYHRSLLELLVGDVTTEKE